MGLTPQNLCGYLIRSQLMTPEEMRGMYERWQTDARENATNLSQFTRWLVANQYVTDYQAALLTKGRAAPGIFFLGPYKIMERVGRGRMAGVYRAVHALGQVVAIKVLPPSRAKNPQLLGRFKREARLAIRLIHPNVVRSFQVGEANGLHYIVMEYQEGETLDEVIRRRKALPPAEAVRLIHQALLGLQHIHEKTMVHRDLKPANIMLVPLRAAGDPDTTNRATVKILDIGLGRMLLDENATLNDEDTELTGDGVILGTPDYMAPEQARDPRTIDARADIYSLGCVLYHLLTGQPPFPDTNLVNQMVRHATETPKPLQEFNPAIPDGLQQIMTYLVAKQADQRYPSALRAAQALHMFLLAEHQDPTPVDEPAPLRKYLTWLETAPAEPEPASPASKPLAESTTDLPVARPVARSVRSSRPTPTPAARSTTERKKHKKHHGAKQAKVPRARPASDLDYDVELVSTPATGGPTTLWLSKRDWIVLGVGGLAVAAASGVVAFILLR